MKKRITLLFGLSLAVGLMFTSCEKDEETTPNQEEKVLYPTKITEYEDGVYDGEITFEYNADKKLVKVVYDSDFYETYAYDTDGKVIEYKEFYNNSLDVQESMEYNTNGQLIKIQRYNNGIEGGWYSYEYDNQGNVSKRSEHLTDGTVYTYRTYEYDINGNLINRKYFWEDYVTGTILTDTYDETTYEYDDKNNIYKNLNLPFKYETYINNVTKEVYTETSDDYTYTGIYTYTYNEDNYPIEYTEDDDERYVIEYQEL
ncbi:MAG: hypothetical protein GQ564_06360 [Bacteroidales bacterium]|nr:hypothetical protein [Bacteroidales bacterium]